MATGQPTVTPGGSNRTTIPESERLGPVAPGESFEGTIRVRRRQPIDAPSLLAPLAARTYVRDAGYADRFGEPDALQAGGLPELAALSVDRGPGRVAAHHLGEQRCLQGAGRMGCVARARRARRSEADGCVERVVIAQATALNFGLAT